MAKRAANWTAEVLEILVQRGTYVTAYGILDELRATHKKVAPMTVYRALSALVKEGRIQRLESLNAFIATQTDAKDKSTIFTICDDCGTVEENFSTHVISQLSEVLGKTGFEVQRPVIEVHGTCADCGPQQTPS